MGMMGAGIPYFLMAALAAAFLWGSILAFRGRRWWGTVVMLVGSGMQVLGALLTMAGTVWMMVQYSSMSGSGSGAPESSAASLASGMMVFMVGGMGLMGLDFILFALGFVAFSARSGAAERRAAELESMVVELQRRMPT